MASTYKKFKVTMEDENTRTAKINKNDINNTANYLNSNINAISIDYIDNKIENNKKSITELKKKATLSKKSIDTLVSDLYALQEIVLNAVNEQSKNEHIRRRYNWSHRNKVSNNHKRNWKRKG